MINLLASNFVSLETLYKNILGLLNITITNIKIVEYDFYKRQNSFIKVKLNQTNQSENPLTFTFEKPFSQNPRQLKHQNMLSAPTDTKTENKKQNTVKCRKKSKCQSRKYYLNTLYLILYHTYE